MSVPVVGDVQRVVSSKSGIIAVLAIAVLVLLIEARTGRLSALLRGTPVIGPFFIRKAS